MLHFLTSLQLRLLLASLPHHPFHLRQPYNQVDHQPNNQLNQPALEHHNQPNQQKHLDRLNYQYFPSLDLTYRPQQPSYQTAEPVFTSKGVEKSGIFFFQLIKSIFLPDEKEPRQVAPETPWKKRTPGHVLLYIPPDVANHATNKGFTGTKRKPCLALFAFC